MIPPNPFILARLFGELWLGLSRALMTPWTHYPTGIFPPGREPGERRAENGSGAQKTIAARAMGPPVEHASDWDGERPSAEVVEFRRNGGM